LFSDWVVGSDLVQLSWLASMKRANLLTAHLESKNWVA
jgi:hypothetical protein